MVGSAELIGFLSKLVGNHHFQRFVGEQVAHHTVSHVLELFREEPAVEILDKMARGKIKVGIHRMERGLARSGDTDRFHDDMLEAREIFEEAFGYLHGMEQVPALLLSSLASSMAGDVHAATHALEKAWVLLYKRFSELRDTEMSFWVRRVVQTAKFVTTAGAIRLVLGVTPTGLPLICVHCIALVISLSDNDEARAKELVDLHLLALDQDKAASRDWRLPASVKPPESGVNKPPPEG